MVGVVVGAVVGLSVETSVAVVVVVAVDVRVVSEGSLAGFVISVDSDVFVLTPAVVGEETVELGAKDLSDRVLLTSEVVVLRVVEFT